MADHDSGYKLLFSHPEMVEELLRGFVREPWVETLDFATLERISTSFVSDDLRERHSDMIWRLRSQEAPSAWFYLYLLLEFQSTPDPFMAVRLLGYIALLLAELVRTGAATLDSGLPTVLPLVLCNGRRPWNGPLDLASLFRGIPPGAERLLPQLTYLLIDENRLSRKDLELTDNRVASLFQIETCNPTELPRLTVQLASQLKGDPQDGLRRAFTAWLLRLLQRLRSEVTIPEVADLEAIPMLEENILDWWNGAREEGRREGERKGRREGQRKGRREGQLAGQRQFLLRVLEQRFGRLPLKVRRKVSALDTSQALEGLLERSLVAANLAELGLS